VPFLSGSKARLATLQAGTIQVVFDLTEVRYIEGAPMDWRPWLTPGTGVVLRFLDDGITVFGAEGHRGHMTWGLIQTIDVRGPDQPEYPSGTRLPPAAGNIFFAVGVLLAYLYRRSKDQLPVKVQFSWLAFRLDDDSQMIFEVEGMLHDRLEAFLEAHSG